MGRKNARDSLNRDSFLKGALSRCAKLQNKDLSHLSLSRLQSVQSMRIPQLTRAFYNRISPNFMRADPSIWFTRKNLRAIGIYFSRLGALSVQTVLPTLSAGPTCIQQQKAPLSLCTKICCGRCCESGR